MLRQLDIAMLGFLTPSNVSRGCTGKEWRKILQNLLLFVFLLLSKPCSAQQRTVTYSYDAAGNRISKTVRVPLRPIGSERQSQNDEDDTQRVGIYLSYNDNMLLLFVPGCCEETPCDYVICSIGGQVINRGHMTREVCEIKTRNFTRGTYVIHLTFNEEQESCKFYKD